MADFKLEIGSGVKTVDITDTNGNVLATKSINVGNKTELKRWIEQLSGLAEINPSSPDGLDVLDEIEAMEKKIINATLGDWDLFWRASGKNPIVLLRTLMALLRWLEEQLNAMYKDLI